MIRREEGQVTAFVVGILLALFVLAGLVIDGGYTLAARRRAINEADGAARAGAQALDVAEFRSSGLYRLDPFAATAAARSYLDVTGHAGLVSVNGDQVSVEVNFDQPMALLRMIGIEELKVTGKGNAVSVGPAGVSP